MKIKVCTAKTETMKWISALKEDAASITCTDISDKKSFKHNFFDWKSGLRAKHQKTGTVWSDKRKRAHSER